MLIKNAVLICVFQKFRPVSDSSLQESSRYMPFYGVWGKIQLFGYLHIAQTFAHKSHHPLFSVRQPCMNLRQAYNPLVFAFPT